MIHPLPPTSHPAMLTLFLANHLFTSPNSSPPLTTLHQSLHTMTFTLNLAIIGPGLVGSEFISQIAAYQARNAATRFSVVAIANSRRQILSSQVSLSSWNADLESSNAQPADLRKLIEHAAAHSPCVVVDCTSNETVASSYPAWLDQGLHIVTPNKKAFSGSLGLWEELQKKSAGKNKLFHESTVGYVG